MPDAPPPPESLHSQLAKQLATDLVSWSSGLGTVRSAAMLALRSTPPQTVQDMKMYLEQIQNTVEPLQREAHDWITGLSRVEQLLKVREAEVKLQTSVMAAYPQDLFSNLVVYAAVVLAGVGGASYVYLGYPRTFYGALPSVILWGAGLGFISIGLVSRWLFQRKQMSEFKTRIGSNV